MKTLGTTASLLLSRLSETGKDIFSLQDAQKILGANSNSTRKLVFDLVQRNWLKRLARGKYLLVPLSVANKNDYTVNELLIASQLVSAYYIHTVDLVLQRVIEVIGHMPQLILLVALFSIYGAQPLTLILTLAVLRGFNTSRILRSVIIQVRTLPFIESARAIGATTRLRERFAKALGTTEERCFQSCLIRIIVRCLMKISHQ